MPAHSRMMLEAPPAAAATATTLLRVEWLARGWVGDAVVEDRPRGPASRPLTKRGPTCSPSFEMYRLWVAHQARRLARLGAGQREVDRQVMPANCSIQGAVVERGGSEKRQGARILAEIHAAARAAATAAAAAGRLQTPVSPMIPDLVILSGLWSAAPG